MGGHSMIEFMVYLFALQGAYAMFPLLQFKSFNQQPLSNNKTEAPSEEQIEKEIDDIFSLAQSQATEQKMAKARKHWANEIAEEKFYNDIFTADKIPSPYKCKNLTL
jgi:hypothetical protein